MKILPTISICIPTYNEENNIGTCLNAIFRQNYPLDKLEVILVDNRSIDKTIEIASSYPVKILYNDLEKHAETSKKIALDHSTGDLFTYIDADIELKNDDYLQKLVMPLMEDKAIAASFGRFIYRENDNYLTKYLRHHPLELDPVFRFFCTEIKNTVSEKRIGYDLCKFIFPRIPPIGICLYRTSILKEALNHKTKMMDIDVPAILAKNGWQNFAYLSDCQFYHENIPNIIKLLKKRIRNILKNRFNYSDERDFQYFNRNEWADRLKILFWIIYANLLFPAFLKNLYKSIYYKKIFFLYEPLLAFILTDAIIGTYAFEIVRRKFSSKNIHLNLHEK
jgi:glycosyltransferase involved in cell wall biosynthesis